MCFMNIRRWSAVGGGNHDGGRSNDSYTVEVKAAIGNKDDCKSIRLHIEEVGEEEASKAVDSGDGSRGGAVVWRWQ